VSTSALRFHRDKNGVARAVWSGADPAGKILSRFFEKELAADAAYCERLLAEAEEHSRAGSGSWKCSGNSFAVSFDAAKVSLRPLFGAKRNRAYLIDACEFLALLQEWRELIRQ